MDNEVFHFRRAGILYVFIIPFNSLSRGWFTNLRLYSQYLIRVMPAKRKKEKLRGFG